ncbi:MAG TPA: glycosyltransferase, partial [Mycobacteriales bacterium]|nr:glycosyltransferase [Mycobacteriales bacterium]
MTAPDTVVDVMLPHYGRLDLVQETVRSVLAQDDPHWRLTIVDDTGEATDGALRRWCAELGDDRVRYELNPRNLGINRNFAHCVELVEHELAVIIGSDDLM